MNYLSLLIQIESLSLLELRATTKNGRFGTLTEKILLIKYHQPNVPMMTANEHVNLVYRERLFSASSAKSVIRSTFYHCDCFLSRAQ